MYVSVYLVDAHVHTVVPQEFVYGLNQVNLNNHGVNTNQNRLIYFSSEYFKVLVNANEPVDIDHIPKFDLPVTKVFPLPNDLQETCFIGRLKKFWGKITKKNLNSIMWINISIFRVVVSFNNAMHHAEKLRSLLPAVYNQARLYEQPIPPIVAAVEMIPDEHDEMEGFEAIENTQTGESNDTNFDVKPPIFAEIELPTQDAAAFDAMFSDEETLSESEMPAHSMDENIPLGNSNIATANNESNSQNNMSLVGNSEPNSFVQDNASIEQIVAARQITVKIIDSDDELECTYTSLASFRPNIVNVYQIKKQDVLCNNRPFKQNVIFVKRNGIIRSISYILLAFITRPMEIVRSRLR